MAREQVSKGFTLAELLVALSVLGVMATFTIPKMLQNQENSKRKAIYRESIAAFHEAMYDGILNRTLTRQVAVVNFFGQRLSTVKTCLTNAQTQGCFPQDYLPDNEETEGGVLLTSGMSIAGLDKVANTTNGYTGIIMDWNGPNGPNLEGEDQLRLTICFDSTASGFSVRCSRENTLFNSNGGGDPAANQILYRSIFQ